MNNIKKIYCSRFITTGIVVLSIILIAFLSFRDVLGYFFIAGDSLSLIDASRIQSLQSIVNIFTVKHLGESFPGNFYRPISILSYSFDYYIWGLNTFGYHLTDLIIHILVAVSVFLFARLLTGGKQIIAWLSAVIFTTHPILITIVPAIDRRQDTLAALFLIVSLILFLKHFSSVSHKKMFLFCSIFIYILALGTKEIAVILPFLIFIYLLIFLNKVSPMDRIRQAFKKAAPFFIATFIVFAWRAYILKRLIGAYYEVKRSLFFDYTIIPRYFNDLLHHADLISPIPVIKVIFVLLLISLFFILMFYKGYHKKIFPTVSYQCKLVIFLFIWLLLPLIIYLSISNFAPWYMYIPLIPFSIILSMLIIQGLWSFNESLRLILITRITISVLTGILVLTFFFHSPLMGFKGEWKDRSRKRAIFLYKLSSIIPELPDGATINILNLPADFPLHTSEVKSWLSLTYPTNNVKAIILKTSPPFGTVPDDLDFEIKIGENNDANIKVILRAKNGKTIKK
jgi:hypothetical protein